MARARSALASIVLVALLAAAFCCLLGGSAFLPAAGKAAARAPGVDSTQAGAAAIAGLAAPLLIAQPAYAVDSPPGWPYVLVFLGLFGFFFIGLPNIFK